MPICSRLTPSRRQFNVRISRNLSLVTHRRILCAAAKDSLVMIGRIGPSVDVHIRKKVRARSAAYGARCMRYRCASLRSYDIVSGDEWVPGYGPRALATSRTQGWTACFLWNNRPRSDSSRLCRPCELKRNVIRACDVYKA